MEKSFHYVEIKYIVNNHVTLHGTGVYSYCINKKYCHAVCYYLMLSLHSTPFDGNFKNLFCYCSLYCIILIISCIKSTVCMFMKSIYTVFIRL